jgi:hypothetical protein
MTFDDLDFELLPSPVSGFEMFGTLPNGVKAVHYFDNGYGIQVLRCAGTDGWENGLFEVSILKKTENQWENTPITLKVIGNCNVKKINQLLNDIENLKPEEFYE